MSTPVECREKLDGYATELDTRSKELAATARALEPVEALYADFLDDFETGLYYEATAEDKRLPGEAMRDRLARKAMRTQAATMLAEHTTLTARRKRLERRIKDLGVQIDAQRSILSALKQEVEASA